MDRWWNMGYLDKNGSSFGQIQVANVTNKSAYAWLYDYTYDCEQYGCKVQDNNIYSYYIL